MLQDAGVEDVDPLGDLSTAQERTLGELVKKKYDTDFYILHKYPRARGRSTPCRTRPIRTTPTRSTSFIRGEEIISGAQRIHDVDAHETSGLCVGIEVPTIQAYLDGGFERRAPAAGAAKASSASVMLFLGLGNIRKTSDASARPAAFGAARQETTVLFLNGKEVERERDRKETSSYHYVIATTSTTSYLSTSSPRLITFKVVATRRSRHATPVARATSHCGKDTG